MLMKSDYQFRENNAHIFKFNLHTEEYNASKLKTIKPNNSNDVVSALINRN